MTPEQRLLAGHEDSQEPATLPAQCPPPAPTHTIYQELDTLAAWCSEHSGSVIRHAEARVLLWPELFSPSSRAALPFEKRLARSFTNETSWGE